MAITLFINEPDGLTDQTHRLFYSDNPSFNLIMGQRGTANLPLRARPDDPYSPTMGSQVFLYDPDTLRAYAGTIDKYALRWIGNDGWRVYMCTCVSFEQVFDTIRVPPTAYFNMAVGDIFTDLYNTYALPLGVPVALGTVQSGPTIDSFVVRWDRLSDLFQKLATLAQMITGVRMSDLTLYLQAPATTPAPFALQKFLWETGNWKQERSDFRDRQLIQIAFTAFSTSNEMFDGDGAAGFINLFRRVDRITSACITISTQATAQAIFGAGSPLVAAQPAPGDTFTIGTAGEEPYTFVTSLDNTLRNQVLIGATADDTAINAFHAIQGTQIWKGVKFSLPTWENDQCNADFPVGNVFTLRCKNPGAGGNGILLNTTSATFHWSASATSAGTDGVSNALRVGLLGAGDTGNDILYSSGSNQLLLAAPIEIGSSLSVAYYALGSDTIAVEDSALVALRAAAEHGSGRYDQIIVDTNVTDAIAGYVEAVNALTAYKTLPKSFTFSIFDAELSPGQLLTISVLAPSGAPVLLDRVWLVHEIQASLVEGVELLPEPYGHFKYSVTVIDVTVIGTFIDFYQNLAIVTPAGSQTASSGNTTIQTATPNLKNPATATPGSPTAGTPSTPAGQQWVQEAPGPYRQWKAKDLVVDGSDNTKVTSASRPFVAGDVASFVTVTGGTGWTPGIYTVTAVVGVIATLNSSPAAVSTTKGEWQLSSGSLYALSWTPLASSYTKNQIAILAVNGLHFTPFAPATPGYVASGGAYEVVNKNQILFQTPLDPTTDTVIATYFPSGIVKEPEGPEAPDAVGTFIAVSQPGSGDAIMTSPDSAAWTSVSTDLDGSGGTCIATDGAGAIVALGVHLGFIIWAILSTDEGVTWSAPTFPNLDLPTGMCFGGGQFVSVSSIGIVVVSADAGATWSNTSTLPTTDSPQWDGVAFGAGVYVAVGIATGVGGKIASSADATTWTPRSSSSFGLGAICFGSAEFVTIGPSAVNGQTGATGVETSADGFSWTAQTAPGSVGYFWNSITFGVGLYVAAGSDGGGGPVVATSADSGVTWSVISVPAAGSPRSIRFLNSLFVLCCDTGGGGAAILTSPDGTTWTAQTTPIASASDVTFA